MKLRDWWHPALIPVAFEVAGWRVWRAPRLYAQACYWITETLRNLDQYIASEGDAQP